jgi:hypothetical protein
MTPSERQMAAFREWLRTWDPIPALPPRKLLVCSREQALALHEMSPRYFPHPDSEPT